MAGSQGDSWVIFRRYTDFCRLSDKVRRYRAPQQLHISKAAYTFMVVKWRAVRSPERLEGVDYIWQMLQHLSISDYYFARPVLTNNIFPHAVKGWFSCMWMCMWIGLRAATICCLICSVRSLCSAHMLHPWIGENITWIKDNTGLFSSQPVYLMTGIEPALPLQVYVVGGVILWSYQTHPHKVN